MRKTADVYLDSAYIVKFYLTEGDSAAVRTLAGPAPLVSSAWCFAEVSCAIHRVTREGRMTPTECQELILSFLEDIDSGIWKLVPVTDSLLRRVSLLVSGAPPNLFLRAGDALHLASAQDQGETEIWTNDRHLLAAAPYFGLAGRTV